MLAWGFQGKFLTDPNWAIWWITNYSCYGLLLLLNYTNRMSKRGRQKIKRERKKKRIFSVHVAVCTYAELEQWLLAFIWVNRILISTGIFNYSWTYFCRNKTFERIWYWKLSKTGYLIVVLNRKDGVSLQYSSMGVDEVRRSSRLCETAGMLNEVMPYGFCASLMMSVRARAHTHTHCELYQVSTIMPVI